MVSKYGDIFAAARGKPKPQVSVTDPPQIDATPPQELIPTDPRAFDLHKDSGLWNILLAKAAVKDRELMGVLHGFRCGGTLLGKNAKGNYYMHPLISSIGWKSQVEYDIAKRKWLVPWKEQIIELMAELREEMEKGE